MPFGVAPTWPIASVRSGPAAGFQKTPHETFARMRYSCAGLSTTYGWLRVSPSNGCQAVSTPAARSRDWLIGGLRLATNSKIGLELSCSEIVRFVGNTF